MVSDKATLQGVARTSLPVAHSRRSGAPAAKPVVISVIMPTISWTGTFDRCARRVLEVIEHASVKAEVVFVFDGEGSAMPSWLARPGVRIVKTGRRSGLAAARNRAVDAAEGEIVFFVDADVEMAADTLDRIDAVFATDPDLTAVIGAYDDEPAALGTASLFRNLLHHHTHTSNPGKAITFWSGCGAIRRKAFLDAGGFDEHFAYPSVEDIELGTRIVASGGKILLSPEVRCKHLKYWTLGSMIHTDIVHRAMPWTRLIMSSPEFPDTLNLDWRGRTSGICSVLLAACLFLSFVFPMLATSMFCAGLACGLVILTVNANFYRLCLKKHGLGFAVSAVSLHYLYFVYSSLTFGAVSIHENWLRWRRSPAGVAHLDVGNAMGRGAAETGT